MTKKKNDLNKENELISVIDSKQGWQLINLKELKDYRDLIFFLIWRDIKVLYAQTILGFSWAILQPLVQIIIFTIVFGKVAKIPTEGIPYFLFSSIAIIPWTYMSQTMTQSSQSLIAGKAMLGKIYFPRLIFPMIPVFARMIDFGLSILIILCVSVYYKVMPTWNLMYLPIFVLFMASVPAGIGIWLSSLAIRFRDVKQAMPFVVRMLIYSAPIVYSASSIPDTYRFFYSLNPIVGVIEGYRACLLGTPMPWIHIWPGMVTSSIIFVSGAFYFKKMERIFVDVI
jgi:lipopolysaccharide transport system permease protein